LKNKKIIFNQEVTVLDFYTLLLSHLETKKAAPKGVAFFVSE
jgi:hypothetical protein